LHNNFCFGGKIYSEIMNNEDFRKLASAAVSASTSTSTSAPQTTTTAVASVEAQVNVSASSAAHRDNDDADNTSSNVDTNNTQTGTELSEKERRARSKAKKHESYLKWQERKALARERQAAKTKYRNRARERQQGVNPDYADIEEETLKQVDVETSKYLGGVIERTHLVKGLDYQLAERVRAQQEEEFESALEAQLDQHPSSVSKLNIDAADAPAAASAHDTSDMTRAICAMRFINTEEQSGGSMNESNVHMYAPGRVSYNFSMSSRYDPPEPSIVLHNREELAQIQPSVSAFVPLKSRIRVSMALRVLRGEISTAAASQILGSNERTESQRIQRTSAAGKSSHQVLSSSQTTKDDDDDDDDDSDIDDIFADAGREYVPTREKLFGNNDEQLADMEMGPARPPPARASDDDDLDDMPEMGPARPPPIGVSDDDDLDDMPEMGPTRPPPAGASDDDDLDDMPEMGPTRPPASHQTGLYDGIGDADSSDEDDPYAPDPYANANSNKRSASSMLTKLQPLESLSSAERSMSRKRRKTTDSKLGSFVIDFNDLDGTANMGYAFEDSDEDVEDGDTKNSTGPDTVSSSDGADPKRKFDAAKKMRAAERSEKQRFEKEFQQVQKLITAKSEERSKSTGKVDKRSAILNIRRRKQ
jgi:RED-like protein N-terminal region